MTVFLGLLTFLGLRWMSDAGRRARILLEQRLAGIHGLRVREVEIVSPETLEGTAATRCSASSARASLQLAILYAYVVFALSQFAATQGSDRTAHACPDWRHLARCSGTWSLGFRPRPALPRGGLFLARRTASTSGFLLDRVCGRRVPVALVGQRSELAGPLKPLIRAALVVGALLIFGPMVGAGTDALLTRLGLLAHCSASTRWASYPRLPLRGAGHAGALRPSLPHRGMDRGARSGLIWARSSRSDSWI